MKKVMVVGATGGMGYAVVRELAGRGIKTIAIARNEQTLQTLFRDEPLVEIQKGDALQKATIEAAAADVDLIVHAINVPYREWAEKQLPMLENLLAVAEKAGAKFILVDNIYAVGEQSGGWIDENRKKQPTTKKGAIRLQMAEKTLQAKIPTSVVHFPDFYGPNAQNTAIHIMLAAVLKNKRMPYIGDPKVKREYIYTFDGARALVEIALKDRGVNEEWYIPGISPISGEDLFALIHSLTGLQKKPMIANKMMLQLIGLFQMQMREMVELLYLFNAPVYIKGDKYEREIGPLPLTPYEEGLKATIASLQQ